jgi:hypothetical protein
MGRAHCPFGEKRGGDTVEDLRPLQVDGAEVGVRIEDVLDDDVAVLGELRSGICGSESQLELPSASVPAIVLGSKGLW